MSSTINSCINNNNNTYLEDQKLEGKNKKYSQRFRSSFKERFADSIIFLNYFAYHEIYMEDSFLTLRKYEGTSES